MKASKARSSNLEHRSSQKIVTKGSQSGRHHCKMALEDIIFFPLQGSFSTGKTKQNLLHEQEAAIIGKDSPKGWRSHLAPPWLHYQLVSLSPTVSLEARRENPSLARAMQLSSTSYCSKGPSSPEFPHTAPIGPCS